MNNNLISSVIDALRAFPVKYPEILDVDTVVATAPSQQFSGVSISELFAKEYPELEGKPLYLLGYRTTHKNRHRHYDEYNVPDQKVQYVVCLTKGDYAVDLTHRQLDTLGEPFVVATLALLKQEWLAVSTEYDGIDFLGSIEAYLRQATREWQRGAFPSITEVDMEKQISASLDDARTCYNKVLRAINSGVLILTGTEENNTYLQKMNNAYKQQFTTTS